MSIPGRMLIRRKELKKIIPPSLQSLEIIILLWIMLRNLHSKGRDATATNFPTTFFVLTDKERSEGLVRNNRKGYNILSTVDNIQIKLLNLAKNIFSTRERRKRSFDKPLGEIGRTQYNPLAITISFSPS